MLMPGEDKQGIINFLKNFSQENKLDIIEMFKPLGFQGGVNLKNPDRTFMIIDNHYLGKKFFGKIIAGKSDGK